MKIWNWLKGLFSSEQPTTKVTADMVQDDDEIMRELVAHVWNTGKTTIASVDEKGNVQYSDVEN